RARAGARAPRRSAGRRTAARSSSSPWNGQCTEAAPATRNSRTRFKDRTWFGLTDAVLEALLDEPAGDLVAEGLAEVGEQVVARTRRPPDLGVRHRGAEAVDRRTVVFDMRRLGREEQQRRYLVVGHRRPRAADGRGQSVHRHPARLGAAWIGSGAGLG